MISVIIGTYGSDEWRQLAWSRAYPSVPRTDEPTAVWREGALVYPSTDILVVHGETLAQARNQGAEHATNDWLCFLDADDELTDGYLTTMTTVIRAFGKHVGDRLFTPRVQYVGQGGREEEPLFHPEVPIQQGNWLVIGTVVPRALFLAVGGFEEWPVYEDYALFARMQEAGAKPVKVPGAIYKAHRSTTGRNHAPIPAERVYWHQRIGHSIWPTLYDATTNGEDDARTLLDQGRPGQRLRLLAVDGRT